MRPPAFQFYADDFLAGTLELSQAEVGSYIRLLCHQWNRGSIPVEPEKQQRLAGGPVSDDVLAKFPVWDDGIRRNRRLEEERAKQAEFREKQRQKGIASGKARRTKVEPRLDHGSSAVGTGSEPDGQPEANSPSPSPSPSPLPTPPSDTPQSPPQIDPTSLWTVAFGLEMPDPLRTTECMESIRAWLRHKAEKRAGYRPTGLRVALAKWSRDFTPAQFCAAVEHSMANGWSGIFSPHERNGNATPSGRRLASADRNDLISGADDDRGIDAAIARDAANLADPDYLPFQ